MKGLDESSVSGLACWLTAAFVVAGLLVLFVRLREVQVDKTASYSYAHARQSVRRVQTAGRRGEIVDCHGTVLAANRPSVSIVCHPAAFRGKRPSTLARILDAIDRVSGVVGRAPEVDERTVRRHLNEAPAMELVVWRNLSEDELARFAESEVAFPGFSLDEVDVRVYPQGRLASHVLGYVGRDRGYAEAGDQAFRYYLPEMRGRAGVELYYDGYLRGVSGEIDLLVDASNYAIRDWTVVAPRPGPELRLSLDVGVQRAAELELRGLKGACAVIDPRTGAVLALASAPDFDPNEFVPRLSLDVYGRYRDDPAKPLLNRASGGAYAPGSTFKTVTALAGLENGVSATEEYECTGVYCCGEMNLRCARRWGHGPMDLPHALMKSCNPFFCNLGMTIGTNALIRTARSFGLGAKTGLDLGVDLAGTVPDDGWKRRVYRERWYPGDLVQMSIGQGMLLATPLQMARVAGAIGTGFLVTPHLKADVKPERTPLPFARERLDAVRRGMRMVVAGDRSQEGPDLSQGTGWRGGEGVVYADGTPVAVAGKTGTAEVGAGESRRKNVWFMAYAPADYPSIAVALVVENGESGGGTAAPKVAAVLREYFGRRRL